MEPLLFSTQGLLYIYAYIYLINYNKMQDAQPDLFLDIVGTKRRKTLLPLWIKIFVWIFLVFGAITPIGLIFGILGYEVELSLYGLETVEPLSISGICILAAFLLKGIVSYGLLTEKKWAIILGIIDAILGFTICLFLMIYPIIFSDSGINFTFRLEIIFLIPYLIKMIKIKSEWESSIGN